MRSLVALASAEESLEPAVDAHVDAGFDRGTDSSGNSCAGAAPDGGVELAVTVGQAGPPHREQDRKSVV